MLKTFNETLFAMNPAAAAAPLMIYTTSETRSVHEETGKRGTTASKTTCRDAAGFGRKAACERDA